jgi:hypothetical protein
MKLLNFFFSFVWRCLSYIQCIFKQEIKSLWTKIKSEKHKRKFEASSEPVQKFFEVHLNLPYHQTCDSLIKKKKTTSCHLLLTILPDLNPIETASCSAARIFLVQSYFIHSVTTKTKSLRQSRQQDKQFRTEKKSFPKAIFEKTLHNAQFRNCFDTTVEPDPSVVTSSTGLEVLDSLMGSDLGNICAKEE